MKNNLGKINAIFVKNINKDINNNKSKKLIKEYVEFIKNNKPLLNEYIVYNALENGKPVYSTNEFIGEAIDTLKNTDKKELKLLNEALLNILIKNNATITEDFENDELYESIEYLIFNKSSMKNFNERSEARKSISEHLENKKSLIKEQSQNKTENVSFDILCKVMINNFNKKYDEQLSEDDKKIFKEIAFKQKDAEKKELFEQYKNECLELSDGILKEEIDEETEARLIQVQKTLNEQVYNKSTYFEDMVKLLTLKNTFQD